MPPDLENTANAAIVPDNIRAAQTIHAAYQLEQARVFTVVERIAVLFAQGLLPLGRGRAAEGLNEFVQSGERLSEQERADLYARALGVPGGGRGGEPNRDFLSLWLRFLSSVALYQREPEASGRPDSPSDAHVRMRRAASALAANVSAHGGGIVAGGAKRLAADVRRLFDILGDPELQSAYGARDAWQVIDQVNARELDGVRNVGRYRTLSTTGSRILGWLADHASTQGDANELDADLVDAVEQWLAASNTSDEAVESWSTPTESPSPSLRPDLPALVRDLLESLGADLGDGNAAPDPGSLAGRVVWFQGARRTGRTLAAHLLAAALSRDIYRVDIAAVISKYLGKTEKHLSLVFDEAKRAGAILLLDEADALFGKRSDVKDAHDRYANIDVAWLVRRIEDYEGLVIVVSNAVDVLNEPCWRQRPGLMRFPRRGGPARSSKILGRLIAKIQVG